MTQSLFFGAPEFTCLVPLLSVPGVLSSPAIIVGSRDGRERVRGEDEIGISDDDDGTAGERETQSAIYDPRLSE